VLLGTTGLDGKFLMPRNHGAQAMLNTARAFETDVPAFSAAFLSVGLAADFIARLTTDILAYEAAIAAKGAGATAQGGATGGLADTTHQAAIALHVLDTIVRNKYKPDPAKLAEWIIDSHVEKHTPVPRPKKTTPPA
jgi:hypothetical protein